MLDMNRQLKDAYHNVIINMLIDMIMMTDDNDNAPPPRDFGREWCRGAKNGGTWEPSSQKIFESAENFTENFTKSHKKSRWKSHRKFLTESFLENWKAW